jgi:hypothetical protein
MSVDVIAKLKKELKIIKENFKIATYYMNFIKHSNEKRNAKKIVNTLNSMIELNPTLDYLDKM